MRRLLCLLVLLATVFGLSQNALAAEDKDESIYVVQERTFSKRGKFEITPIFMAKANAKYSAYIGGALALSYHIRENFSLQLTGAIAYDFYPTSIYEIQRFEKKFTQYSDMTQMKWFATAGIQWSPFYGKLRLVPGVLGDFDIYVGAGLGVADTREPCEPSGDESCHLYSDDEIWNIGIKKPDLKSDRFKLAGDFSVGLRIFFKNWFGVRLEVRDIVYSTKVDNFSESSTSITNNLNVFLGFSFLLGK